MSDSQHDAYFQLLSPESKSAPPADADEAIRALNTGNLAFANWLANVSDGDESNRLEAATGLSGPNTVSKQTPFGIAVGCSDARFPLRLALGQKTNSLFAVLVAGNVLAGECVGSVDYALLQMPSVKVVTMLGHTHCGAVTAAVDAYLHPSKFNASNFTVGLRAILQRLMGPVLQSVAALKKGAPHLEPDSPAYREALINTAVYVNAAMGAHELLLETAQCGRSDVNVLFGAFDLQDYRIKSPQLTGDGSRQLQSGLWPAPASTEELEDLADIAAAAILHQD